jgi:hypothetical protein
MALDPLLAEIDEDYRREKMKNLWRAVGSYIITVTGLILLGTIAIVAWQGYQNKKSQQLTARLLEARQDVTQDRRAQALEALDDVIAADHRTLSGLAMLWAARLSAADDGEKSRQSYLTPLLSDTASPEPYHHFAHLLAMDDKGHAEEMLHGPFALTAREIRALDLLKQGKRQEAAEQFRVIAESVNAPQTLRQRARLMLGTELADVSAPEPTADAKVTP